MYAPYNFTELNRFDNFYSPSMVKSCNNLTFAYWERSLFHRLLSVFDVTIPEDWSESTKQFMMYCLFRFGYVAVSETAEYGIWVQPCTLKGRDFYYQPTNLLVTNPALRQSLDLVRGRDGELLRLTPDYFGVWDIIRYYAEKLSAIDGAIDMSIVNNKFAFAMIARNKGSANALRKMIDKINRGEPAVILDKVVLNDQTDKDTPWHLIERTGLKENYLTTEQLADRKTLLSNFDAEIGIDLPLQNKKERLVTGEVDATEEDAKSRITLWLDCLKESLADVKKLYPDLVLDFKLAEKREVVDNADGENNNSVDA